MTKFLPAREYHISAGVVMTRCKMAEPHKSKQSTICKVQNISFEITKN
ncbi:hypothetical protein [Helicobacter marmotae]|nr:hypothetical protein [Helicobacter marmotae]